jgi:hypothetical protein
VRGPKEEAAMLKRQLSAEEQARRVAKGRKTRARNQAKQAARARQGKTKSAPFELPPRGKEIVWPMDIAEASRKSGFSYWTLYREVRSGRLHGIRVGRKLKIDWYELAGKWRQPERAAE